jgi:hypothetical protein
MKQSSIVEGKIDEGGQMYENNSVQKKDKLKRKTINSEDDRWLLKRLAPVRFCPLLTGSDIVNHTTKSSCSSAINTIGRVPLDGTAEPVQRANGSPILLKPHRHRIRQPATRSFDSRGYYSTRHVRCHYKP